MAKLTEKQKAFVEHYLVDLNATQAAIKAGYSEKTARSIGCSNLTKVDIQEEIQKRREELTQAEGSMTPEEVLHKLAVIARSNIKDVCSWDEQGVTMKPSTEIPERKAFSISEVSSSPGKEGAKVRVKMVDKLKALDLIAKILGMGEQEPEESTVDWVYVGQAFADAITNHTPYVDRAGKPFIPPPLE